MFTSRQAQEVMSVIRRLDRAEVVRQMCSCHAHFRVDFTVEWFERQPLDELRHVYAALCLQCEIMPSEPPQSPSGDSAMRAA